MVAASASDWQCGGKADGRASGAVAGAASGLVIERLKAVPDLTLKALVAELAEHGIATCPASVWRLVRSEGMSFKKKPVRRGASSASDCEKTPAVEEISGTA